MVERGVRASGALPVALTSFIGREAEIAAVMAMLPSARLLTLIGAGGCGKTRLALAVAAGAAANYPDGVRWVELAPVANPAQVVQSVAAVLGVREQPGQPVVETLAAALRAWHLLLVLDNCEHLVEACAGLGDTLLRACPRLSILATSRQVLSVAGEVAWRVPSLRLPEPDQLPMVDVLAQADAVRLFVERARLVRPGFALTDRNAATVAQICQRLDGLPLAIELAAARLNLLSPEQIAARLDDRFRLLARGSQLAPPRHQTLGATVEWSHGLLTDSERVLLRRLAVFAGGWTLEAAEEVGSGQCAACGRARSETPSLPTAHCPLPTEVLDLLARLVDRSLVQAEEWDGAVRYRLLETIREYARERLRAAGEEARVRHQHTAWCLALAEQAAPELHGPEVGRWLARLDTEHDNLRAALAWCLADADGAEAGLRLAAALGSYWAIRGTLSEGLAWFERALARSDPVPPSARAAACGEGGYLAELVGNYARATPWLEEGLARARALGDGRVSAYALARLGRVAGLQGDAPAARAYLDEGVAVARVTGDRLALATVLFYHGVLAQQGDEASARRLAEGLGLLRAVGDRHYTALALSQLGSVATDRGELAVARGYLEEAVALQRGLGMVMGLANTLRRLGRVARLEGDYPAARAWYASSLTIARGTGSRLLLMQELAEIAGLAAAEGQAERAVRLFGAAEAVRLAIGNVVPRTLREGYARDLAAARAGLGEAAFVAAWAAGQVISLEQAVDEALAVELPAKRPVASEQSLPAKPVERGSLTPREREIAVLVARGLSNPQIGAELSISERTAERHVGNILDKLGFTSRAQVAAWAAAHGLLAAPPA